MSEVTSVADRSEVWFYTGFLKNERVPVLEGFSMRNLFCRRFGEFILVWDLLTSVRD